MKPEPIVVIPEEQRISVDTPPILKRLTGDPLNREDPPLDANDLRVDDVSAAGRHYNAGVMRLRRGEWARSIEDFSKAIASRANLSPAWNNRGVARDFISTRRWKVRDGNCGHLKDSVPGHLRTCFRVRRACFESAARVAADRPHQTGAQVVLAALSNRFPADGLSREQRFVAKARHTPCFLVSSSVSLLHECAARTVDEPPSIIDHFMRHPP